MLAKYAALLADLVDLLQANQQVDVQVAIYLLALISEVQLIPSIELQFGQPVEALIV